MEHNNVTFSTGGQPTRDSGERYDHDRPSLCWKVQRHLRHHTGTHNRRTLHHYVRYELVRKPPIIEIKSATKGERERERQRERERERELVG